MISYTFFVSIFLASEAAFLAFISKKYIDEINDMVGPVRAESSTIDSPNGKGDRKAQLLMRIIGPIKRQSGINSVLRWITNAIVFTVFTTTLLLCWRIEALEECVDKLVFFHNLTERIVITLSNNKLFIFRWSSLYFLGKIGILVYQYVEIKKLKSNVKFFLSIDSPPSSGIDKK